jgi:hypothetical protein
VSAPFLIARKTIVKRFWGPGEHPDTTLADHYSQ